MQKTVKLHDLEFEPFITEEEIKNRVAEIGKSISEEFKGKNPLFIAVLNGAFVFAADLARACPIDLEVVFIRLSSYHGLATSGTVKTVIGLNSDIENRHLIIIEDIVDSGITMYNFLKDLKERKPASVSLATLLLKPDALQFPIKPTYVGFEIPTKFVVGYGLDFAERHRTWPFIAELKKEAYIDS